MASRELVAYVNERRKEGYTDDQIKTALQAAGYPPADIAETFQASTVGPVRPAMPTAPANAPALSAASTAVPAASADPSESSSRLPKNAAIILGIVGVLIVGGGAFAYVRFVNTGPSPESIINTAIDKGFHNIQTVHFLEDIALDADLHSGKVSSPSSPLDMVGMLFTGSSTLKVGMHVDGTSDVTDKVNPKVDEKLTLTLGVPSQGLTATLGGEARIIGEKVYFEVTEAPNLGFFDPSSFTNKWILVDLASLAASTTVPAPSLTLSDSNIAAMVVALQKAYTVTQTLPDGTTPDGMLAYHYAYTVNKQELVDLLNVLTAAAHESSTASVYSQAQLSGLIANLSNLSGEIWVGKNDGYIRQFGMKLAFATSTPSFSASVMLIGTSTTDGINQPVTIDVPTGAEDLQKLVSSMVGPTLPGKTGTTKLKKQ